MENTWSLADLDTWINLKSKILRDMGLYKQYSLGAKDMAEQIACGWIGQEVPGIEGYPDFIQKAICQEMVKRSGV